MKVLDAIFAGALILALIALMVSQRSALPRVVSGIGDLLAEITGRAARPAQ